MTSARHDRRKLKRLLQQELGEDFDPVLHMAKNAMLLQVRVDRAVRSADEVDEETFVSYIKDANGEWDRVAPYVNPKMKSVEFEGEFNGEFKATINWINSGDTGSVPGSDDSEPI